MKKYSFGGYRVEINMTDTEKWYRNYPGWGCGCGHCRNFLKLASQRKLPESVLAVLGELPVLPEKATYVGELYTDGEGVHYQFSYRLAGSIVMLPEDSDESTQMRCCHESYPYGAPDFPTPNFDLEFFAVLPWVLEEG